MGDGYANSKGVSLRVEGLTLVRGERLLVDKLSFALDAHSFAEIRGRNGSGKTTLLRAIAGYVRPKTGRIVLGGVEEPTLAMHYVGHLNALKGAASVREHVQYWLGLFGVAGDPMTALERVGLARQAGLPARALSQGQARRLALARLLTAPRLVWLLDEPAAGLDTQGRALLADLIAAQVDGGGMVLAAIHEALGPAATLTLTVGP